MFNKSTLNTINIQNNLLMSKDWLKSLQIMSNPTIKECIFYTHQHWFFVILHHKIMSHSINTSLQWHFYVFIIRTPPTSKKGVNGAGIDGRRMMKDMFV